MSKSIDVKFDDFPHKMLSIRCDPAGYQRLSQLLLKEPALQEALAQTSVENPRFHLQLQLQPTASTPSPSVRHQLLGWFLALLFVIGLIQITLWLS